MIEYKRRRCGELLEAPESMAGEAERDRMIERQFEPSASLRHRRLVNEDADEVTPISLLGAHA